MSSNEREMIYEINCLRSNPRSWLIYIEPMLDKARKNLKEYGKGPKSYSLTYTTETINGKETKKVDTNWHYSNTEEVNALTSLVNDLKKLKPLSVLQPDSGIYRAVKVYAADQEKHNWGLLHIGSDGSMPWDRITKYSPSMAFGNENIAGNSAYPTPRDIVIQLLVDQGIPGYGHRYNLLDPQWTHVACFGERYKGEMDWWLQNFGRKR